MAKSSQKNVAPSSLSRKNPKAVIIGAGMTGILLGIKLRQAGEIKQIEETEAAMVEWTATLNEKMSGTTWATGCQSWYLDDNDNPLAWPDTWSNWLRTMQNVDLSHFKA